MLLHRHVKNVGMSTELKMSVYFGSGVVNSGGLKFFELTQIHFESQLVLFVVKTKFASSTDKYIFSFHVLIFLDWHNVMQVS